MGSLFGSKKSPTQTTTNSVPAYISNAGKAAAGIAGELADQEYLKYPGTRVAGTSPMTDLAFERTLDSSGAYQDNINRASDGTGAAYGIENQVLAYTDPNRSYAPAMWDTEQANKYMNPYIEGALEPAAREMRDEHDVTVNKDNASAASQGAMRGSRSAVLEGIRGENMIQGMNDLYAGGYKDAYASALDAFNLDSNRALETAKVNEGIRSGELDRMRAVSGDLRDLAGTDLSIANTGSTLSGADIGRLFAAGSVDQEQNQRTADLGYSDFLEERDWLSRGLNYYSQVLGSAPNEGTKTTSTKGGGSSALSQVAGLASAASSIFKL